MKTAMQELFDKYYESNIYNSEFNQWLIENEESLLQKEKDQIRMAYVDGVCCIENRFTNSLEYYNHLYNQNQ